MDFEAFVRMQQLPLVRLAFVYSGDRHLAEDVVQEVLMRLFIDRARTSVVNRPAYARRMVLNELHSRARVRAASDVLSSRLPDRPGVDGDSVAERDHALRLLRGLPHRQKAVLFLRYLEDWPDAEIAAALGCSQLAVRLLSKRGLDRLRREAAVPMEELA